MLTKEKDRTMRTYSAVWNEIKNSGKASVTVSKDHARTMTAGVIETKSDENTVRRKVGLVGWSKLKITRIPLSATHMRVDFELVYSTNL
jgi:hypothetical protein